MAVRINVADVIVCPVNVATTGIVALVGQQNTAALALGCVLQLAKLLERQTKWLAAAGSSTSSHLKLPH